LEIRNVFSVKMLVEGPNMGLVYGRVHGFEQTKGTYGEQVRFDGDVRCRIPDTLSDPGAKPDPWGPGSSEVACGSAYLPRTAETALVAACRRAQAESPDAWFVDFAFWLEAIKSEKSPVGYRWKVEAPEPERDELAEKARRLLPMRASS
jgi:hypothetical protein